MHETITIIGAGMAGLLDLSEAHGQAALKVAGLHDALLERVRPGEDAKRVVDKDGRVLLKTAGGGAGGRPEIDRGDLRKLLTRSIPADAINWGHKVSTIGTLGGGRHRVTFENGCRVTCDGSSARTGMVEGAAARLERHAGLRRHVARTSRHRDGASWCRFSPAIATRP